MEQLLNLRDLLQHEIEDLYSAEEQIIEALPLMIENTTNRELKKALKDHLQVTKEQKRRLDKVKKLMAGGEEISEEKKSFLERLFGEGTKCKGVEGLIKEGQKMMAEDMEPAVMNAAIIGAAQKIEHYEISGYGTARAYARELGLRDVVKLLEATLKEEYQTDKDLTALALKKVNVAAEKGSRNAGVKTGRTNKGSQPAGRKVAPKKGGSAAAKGRGGAAKKAGTRSRSAAKKTASQQRSR